jgi:alkylated DNA repair dioxygenase AlkB
LTEQLALFADNSSAPEGLRYAADFISSEVERELIARIAALPLQPFQFGQYQGKRRVASFGFRYDYTERRLREADFIPDWLSPVIERVEAFGGPGTEIAQVLCTEYDTGVGIGWHRDKPHFDKVLGLSLGSPCAFRFRRRRGKTWERHTLAALPRSLYMMDGEARSQWEHSIPPVEAKRYSITFRTMKRTDGSSKTKCENNPMHSRKSDPAQASAAPGNSPTDRDKTAAARPARQGAANSPQGRLTNVEN